MSAHIVRAHVRTGLQLSRRTMVVGTLAAVGLFIASALLPSEPALALIPIAAVIGIGLVMMPAANLGQEKLIGTMELDRTLPVPLLTLAGARLISAAVRASPVVLFIAIPAFAAGRAFPEVHRGSLATVAVVLTAATIAALWVSYAMIARFSMKRLPWLLIFAWLAPLVIPDAFWDAVGATVKRLGQTMFVDAAPSVLLLGSVSAAALLLAGLVFLGARALLANALDVYRFEPMALDDTAGKMPKREMGAAGRGALLAVTRLRLRLATNRFKHEAMIIGAFIVVILLDIEGIAEAARGFLPIFASLMPTMVAVQLLQDRAQGTLEGLQQLPHPRHVVTLGHLLAVAAIAVPAVIAWSVAQAAGGGPLDALRFARQYLSLVAAGHLMAAFVVWGTARRMLLALIIVVLLAIAAVVTVALLAAARGGPSAVEVTRDSAVVSYIVMIGATIVIAVATALFTHGLTTLKPMSPIS